MKFIIFSLLIMMSCSTQAQQYETISDPSDGKILKGIISRDVLAKDSLFKWYSKNLSGYTANGDALKGLKLQKDSIRLITFMGTWCEDSHYIIPKFFTLLDQAGIGNDRVSLFAVDRNKKTLGYMAEAMGVTNVPTIIVMKNGKEVGRVVEYGKTGLFDKDLGQVLMGMK